MKSLSDTLMGRVLSWLAGAVVRRRWLFFWPQIILFVISVIYTCFHFHVDMNRDNLVGGEKGSHEIYLQYKKEFPAQDDLVVVVESDNQEKNRQFVERLGRKLETETNIFTDVFFKGDLPAMGRKGMLFFGEQDLKDTRQALTNFIPFIAKFTQATNLYSLFSLINSEIYHAKHEDNPQNDALLGAIPMLTRIASQATASLRRAGTPPSPGVFALMGAGEEAEQKIYVTYAGGHIFLLTARARSEEVGEEAVERMGKLASETSREIPGLNVGVMGESVLDYYEMKQSQHDSTLASIVSLVICALIFIYGYQETGRPLKATVCLIVGLGYTLAFTMLVVGHLNILTITFVPILIGLAIDFGVHLITRYEEELRHGRTEEEAMYKAMVFTGQGIFTGAMTTAVAFLAMALTHFKGIQEMGIICGGGMIVCFIPMMTMLPVMLLRGRQNVLDHQPHRERLPKGLSLRARIENIWLRRPITTAVITAVLTLLAVTQLHKVYFDYDLLHMQSAGLPAVVFEQKLIANSSQSVLFAAVVADTPAQALELEAKLRALPSVSTNISMAPFLVGDPTEKLKLIAEIKDAVAPIHFKPIDTRPVALEPLSGVLYSTAGYMGAIVDEVQKGEDTNKPAATIMAPRETLSPGATAGTPPAVITATNRVSTTNIVDQTATNLIPELLDLRSALTELRKQMLNMPANVASEKLAAYQQALFGDVHKTFAAIQNQDNSSRLTVDDLPPSLRDRFVGSSGKLLIQVYPKKDIWQHDNQAEFIKEVRTVDPRVTGTPVQLLEYTTLLKDSYILAAYYALAAIAIMVAFHFRSFTFSILALLPVGIGVIWMCGLMGVWNIPFNPANIMTLPLVIGIGVTNGIHILNRYIEEHDAGILSKSTGKAVFVSGLTAISGFGSLMLGKHRGIRSLGEVMSLGIALCMIAALAFLPAVLNLWGKRGKKKQPSDDNARSTLGREEPR